MVALIILTFPPPFYGSFPFNHVIVSFVKSAFSISDGVICMKPVD